MLKTLFVITLTLILSFHSKAAKFKIDFFGSINTMYIAECTNLVNFWCSDWDTTHVNRTDFYDGNLVRFTDSITGSFVYDTSLDYVLTGDGHQAIYWGAISEYSINIGEISLPNNNLPQSVIGNDLAIIDDRVGVSKHDAFAASTWFSLDDWFASSDIFLLDRSADVFDGFDVPILIDLEDFTDNIISLGFVYGPTGDQLQIAGKIDSLIHSSLNPVNSPSTIFLCFLVVVIGISKKTLYKAI